jgi:hypothetical protein
MRPAAVDPRPLLWHWERWAALVWGLSLVVVSARLLLMPRSPTVYQETGRNYAPSRSVYREYGEAGHHWRAGQDLYQGLGGYRYSPPVTLLFAGFSYLPARAGEVLWRLFSAGLFLGGLAWWGRCGLPRPLTPGQHGLLLLLAAPLSLSSLNNGQANLFLAGLLVLAVTASARGRWNVAALCLVVAVLLKAYPVAVALLLVVLYPRQLGWRLPLGLALGLALPFLLQDQDYVSRQYHSWLGDLRSDDRTAWPLETSYRDMWLLCRLWHLPLGLGGYRVVQLGAAALAAGLCLAGRRAGWPAGRLLPLLFVLGSCWMMLFGPATESSTYCLFAAPLAWAALDAFAGRRPAWVRGGVAVSYGLVAGAFVAGWFPFAPRIYTLGPHPLGALVLWLTVLVQMLTGLRRPGAAEPAPPAARAA